MAKRIWERAPVGEESNKSNWTNPDCVPFRELSHVCHLDAAISILRLGKIRSGLVYDESKLRDYRICVAWFSPNYWHLGSRYGNVAFNFAWPDLIEELDPFWVERLEGKVPAHRFLFSAVDRTSLGLIPYDPSRHKGPWALRDSGHVRNGDVCLEVMLERDVRVGESSKLSFVDHHGSYCNIRRDGCADSALSASRGGAIFLAKLVSERIKPPNGLIRNDESTVDGAMEFLAAQLVRKRWKTPRGVREGSKRAPSVARAVLSAYGLRAFNDAKTLKLFFRTPEDLLSAVIAECEACLGFGPELDAV